MDQKEIKTDDKYLVANLKEPVWNYEMQPEVPCKDLDITNTASWKQIS